MDVRDVAFDAGTFDVAIDKGTMDAMMTAKGDVWVCQLPSHWILSFISLSMKDPPEEVVRDCTDEVNEVMR